MPTLLGNIKRPAGSGPVVVAEHLLARGANLRQLYGLWQLRSFANFGSLHLHGELSSLCAASCERVQQSTAVANANCLCDHDAPPPSRITGQFTYGQFARNPADPRTSRNPSINAPCMEVTTAPSMSIISINAGVPVCAPCAASSVCTAHVNLDSDIIGESRHKAGGHTQCNNARSVTVAGMLHSVVPDDCKTDHTFSAYTVQSRLNITQIRTRQIQRTLRDPTFCPFQGDGAYKWFLETWLYQPV